MTINLQLDDTYKSSPKKVDNLVSRAIAFTPIYWGRRSTGQSSNPIFVFTKLLTLGVFFSFLGSHNVYAAPPTQNSLPVNVQENLGNYDELNPPSPSQCTTFPQQQYFVESWISPASDTRLDSIITEPAGTTQVNLQLNELIFPCYTISTGAAGNPMTHYIWDNNTNTGSGGGGVPAGIDLTSSSESINSASIISGGGSLSSVSPSTITINRDGTTRFWFAAANFTYTYTGSPTVTIQLNITPINTFHYNDPLCVDGAVNGIPIVATSSNPPANCPSHNENFTIKIQEPSNTTDTLTGNITGNGSPANNVTVQVCTCGGLCGPSDPDNKTPAGKNITGPRGNYTLVVIDGTNTCISVLSGAPPGSPTLVNPPPQGFVQGSEYVIKPVNGSSGGFDFAFNFSQPMGIMSGSCSTAPNAVTGEFTTAAEAPSPSVTVSFSTGGTESTAASPASGPIDVYTGDYQSSAVEPASVPTGQQSTGPYTYSVTYFLYSTSSTDMNGVVTITDFYDTLNYQEEFTQWTYGVGLPLSAEFSTSGAVQMSDNYGDSNFFSACDTNMPNANPVAACSTVGIAVNASDFDVGTVPDSDISNTIGNPGQGPASGPEAGGNIDMSQTDQLSSHIVTITVVDMNQMGQMAPAGYGWAPSITQVTYGPCYTASCGGDTIGTVIANQGAVPVIVNIIITAINGAPPPPASHMDSTLSDSFNGLSGYNNPSISNSGVLSNDVPAPPGGLGNYTLAWDFLDNTAGVNIPCSTSVFVGFAPYLGVTGGDVIAGSGFGLDNDCMDNPDAGIIAYNQGSNGTYAGAGTEFAAQALAAIDGFASSQGGTDANTPQPLGLSFANTMNNAVLPGEIPQQRYGGDFGSAACATDYYSSAPAPGVNPGAADLGGLVSGGGAVTESYGGDLVINPSGSSTIPNGAHLTIYVKGNVFIQNNVIYNTTNWNQDLSAIPSFDLVVEGNLYIGSNVTELDGIYIAEPTSAGSQTTGIIYDCTSGNGNSTFPGFSTCGNNKLTIYGSFVANNIQFMRTYGNLYGGTLPQASAEQFIYDPEVWLSTPSGLLNSTYEKFFDLPPVF